MMLNDAWNTDVFLHADEYFIPHELKNLLIYLVFTNDMKMQIMQQVRGDFYTISSVWFSDDRCAMCFRVRQPRK